MSADNTRMMTRSECAKYTGLAVATLERHAINGGGPPYYKLGRACRYSRRDVDAWLDERHVSSTSEYDRLPAAGADA